MVIQDVMQMKRGSTLICSGLGFSDHLSMPPESVIVCKHMLTIRTTQETQQGDPANNLSGGRGEGGRGCLEVNFKFFRRGS